MSLGIKVYTFAISIAASTAVGIGYGLSVAEKHKTLATHPDDPKCQGGHRHCINDKGEIYINFLGKTINKRT